MSQFRTLLPQIIAMTGKNLLLIEFALVLALPTVLIPALRGLQPDRYPPDETALHFSVAQASWFGGLAYILKPIGSALSGWATELIGRKRVMLLVNVPLVIGWAMLYSASSTEEVFGAATLLGLGIGFMEAPVVTYVGEICQPSIRGVLVACTGVTVMLGLLIMYLLGAITTWRNVAQICMMLPIFSFLAICFLPESPFWLLSQNRAAEAERSLQWLRGWVPRANVAAEFNEMKRYSENFNSCMACQKAALKCPHPPAGFSESARELRRKRTLRPFALIIFCFVVSQFGGMPSIRPYMVQILTAFEVPIDPNWTTVLIGVMSLMGIIVVTFTVSVIGKRKLYLISLTGTGLSCFAISIYAYNKLPMDQSSFDLNRTVVADHSQSVPESGNYIVMLMFLCLAFCTSLGSTHIPWMYLSELYPLRTRGTWTGFTSALSYILTFVAVNLYANIESSFTIFGTFLFYGIVNIFGLCVLFVILPETEGRTLEEIELFFSDNQRPLNDRHIRQVTIADDRLEILRTEVRNYGTLHSEGT